ncbi:MAB_1171c family putative transporter [Streptomyces sp. NPDC048479]|uniref:MAB_1171c family putative transporter n=1 Tax=Streptomyces sp. NPDC048479 TaxID=3154725 RepID=UPI00341566F6
MIAEWVVLGRRLETVAVVVLWIAVVLRAPSTVRLPRQRGLWLAVATAAAAMTLSLVTGCLVRRTGESFHVLSLLTNLFGVVSASAVLDFVVTATGSGRRYRNALYFMTVGVILALVVEDRLAPSHAEHGIEHMGSCHPGLAYWLILIGAHLTADAACAAVCGRYSRRSDNRVTRTTLRLFGLGTAFAGLYWIGQGLRLALPVDWVAAVLPFCMVLHALLRASAITIPVVSAARQTVRRIMTIWRLWPLWYDLTSLVPHVVLDRRRSRPAELLRPHGPFSLLQYRKIIEIRDALLVLQGYCRPSVPDRARAYLRTVRTPPVSHDAAVLACVLRQARRAMLDHLPPQPLPVEAAASRTADLHEETSFLVQVAMAYSSPVIRDFDSTEEAVRRDGRVPTV